MKLSLGTVQFGLPYGIANKHGQVSSAEAAAIINLARSHSIDLIDTAMSYGDSEACLGLIGMKGLDVVTKLPTLSDRGADVGDWVRKRTQESFDRLQVDRIYGLLFHSPDQLLRHDGRRLYEAVVEMKKAGLLEKIGVSIYDPEILSELCEKYDLDIVQAPFNLVDRRLHTTGWMKRLKDQKIEIHTRSAFLQGLLLMNHNELPSRFSRWNDLWQRWFDWQHKSDISPLEACLAWPRSFSEIDRILVGVDSAQQLEQIIQAYSSPLIPDLPEIESDDSRLVNPSCWNSL